MSKATHLPFMLMIAVLVVVAVAPLAGVSISYAARYAAVGAVVVVGTYITVRVIQLLDEAFVLLRRLNDRDR